MRLLIVLLLATVLPAGDDLLTVVSVNVRQAGADRGEQAWEKRRALMLEVLSKSAADIIGTQELLASQAADLRAGLPGYHFHGVGREDGKEAGEFSALLWSEARFTAVAQGHFWLSPTPDQPGSKGWDSALARMASWARLRRIADGREFVVLNAHFDHIGRTARLESAKLIRSWLATQPGSPPVLVTGDFNSGEGDPPLAWLTGAEGPAPQLEDTWRALHTVQPFGEGTFHAWTGVGLRRIDFILASAAFTPVASAIIGEHRGTVYPSDHFPIQAQLRLK